MNIRLSGITNDSIVDGAGIRLTVFTQGCPHHCPLCHNPTTHDPMGGYIDDCNHILHMLKENPLLDGITLSGGEPFDQPLSCLFLAKNTHTLGLNVWAYTGYLWEDLLSNENLMLLKEIDVLVDGLFIDNLRSFELVFRGSTNQRIINVQKSLATKQIVLWQV